MRAMAFNPKLDQVTISIVLITFAFLALVVTGDAIRTPAWYDGRPYGLDFAYGYLNSPLGPLIGVGLFTFPILVWHVCDALVKEGNPQKKQRFLFSYRAVLLSFFAGMLGLGIILSGFTEWLSCWSPEPTSVSVSGSTFGFLCTPRSGYLIEFLVFPFCLISLVLAFLKAGELVFSRLK